MKQRLPMVYVGMVVVVALMASMLSWTARPAAAAASSKRLSVPFLTQLGSAGVSGSGSMNCGPASIAMTMRYFGKSISVQDAAVAIRGYNTNGQGGTDFKWQSVKDLLAKNNMKRTDVWNYEGVQQQLSDGNPVVILVDSYKYRSRNPYSSNDAGWFTTHHIVVVTGYDKDNVWVNDPLRTQSDLQMPVAMFKQAAEVHGWYAVAISNNGGSNGGGGSNTPSQPRGLQIKDIKNKSAKIDWDSQSGVNYFCVNWSDKNATPNGCDVTVKGSDSSYKPTDLKANKTYYVWVQACNSNNVCSSAAKTSFKTKK